MAPKTIHDDPRKGPCLVSYGSFLIPGMGISHPEAAPIHGSTNQGVYGPNRSHTGTIFRRLVMRTIPQVLTSSKVLGSLMVLDPP